MKFRKYLIPVALLFSILFFTAATDARATQVGILLPRTGTYNFWNIQFYDHSGNLVYDFYTDNSTYNSEVLGDVDPGTYRIEFYCAYSGLFDLGVVGPNFYHFELGENGHQYYGAVIEDSTYLQLDKYQ